LTLRQKFQYLTTQELKALHGDDFLEIVTIVRVRIQKMNPKHVAEATGRTLQCVLSFISGGMPRSSTLSAMLKHIITVDGAEANKSVTIDRPNKARPRQMRADFRKKLRYERPVRRSVQRRQKRA
jgi:hypothetical protein